MMLEESVLSSSITSAGTWCSVYGSFLEKKALIAERTVNRIITGKPELMQASIISGAIVTITPPMTETKLVPMTLIWVG
jgi:hypothetical protein